MRLTTGQKLVFIGDSVTDCGRGRPIGEGLGTALGDGYVSLVNGLLEATYPEAAIRVVNVGSSGNTVRDLAQRWQSDVMALNPDWLSIMIGINDVWRQFDSPHQSEIHVLPQEYGRTLLRLCEEVRPTLAGGLILMTPFYIESLADDAMRQRMDEYGAMVRQVAHETEAIFVDTQVAFNAVLEHMHSAAIAWDRVHPNRVGHTILARAFLNAIEFSWSGETS